MHDSETVQSVNLVRFLVVCLYLRLNQTNRTDLHFVLQECQTRAILFRSSEGTAHSSSPIKVRCLQIKDASLDSAHMTQDYTSVVSCRRPPGLASQWPGSRNPFRD